MPPVRTRDNLDLPPAHYAIRINGVEVARGEAPAGTVLAIGDNLGALPGHADREPVFGLAAKWVPAELRHQAELGGATVVDRASVITTHLAEVVRQPRRPPARPRGRQDRSSTWSSAATRSSSRSSRPRSSASARSSGCCRRCSTRRCSIRDLVRIFEALSLRAPVTHDLDGLVEAARLALGPAIVAPYVVDNTVHVISLEPALEQRMLEALRATEHGPVIALDPTLGQQVLMDITRLATDAENQNLRPVLICAPQIRPALRRMIRPDVRPAAGAVVPRAPRGRQRPLPRRRPR